MTVRHLPPSQRRNVALGLAAVLVTAVSLAVAYRAQDGLPWRDAYRVRVTLPDAANLARHDMVRMAGRRIGQVAAVKVVRGGAELTLKLDESVAPLAADTTARLRARSALGQHFLELQAGTSAAGVRSGGTIRAAAAPSSVQLDQVLSTFDPRTRARTRELLGQLGVAANGRGTDTAATLGAMPGLLADVTTLARALNRRGEPAGAFIDGSRTAVAAAEPRAQELAAGYLPAARALAPVSDERRAVRSALGAAPATLRTVAHELGPTVRLLDALGRLSTTARPLFEAAPHAFGETAGLLPDAGPGLARLEPVFDRLRDASAPTLRLLRDLRRAAPSAVVALGDGADALRDLAGRPCQLRRWLHNWGGRDGIVGSRSDSAGFLRFTFVAAEAPLTAARRPAGDATAYPDRSDCAEVRR